MIKYILVSQGIKIYETFNKSEAERIMYSRNEEWRRYVEKCIVNGEPYVDNEIFMYKEEVNDNGWYLVRENVWNRTLARVTW